MKARMQMGPTRTRATDCHHCGSPVHMCWYWYQYMQLFLALLANGTGWGKPHFPFPFPGKCARLGRAGTETPKSTGHPQSDILPRILLGAQQASAPTLPGTLAGNDGSGPPHIMTVIFKLPFSERV